MQSAVPPTAISARGQQQQGQGGRNGCRTLGMLAGLAGDTTDGALPAAGIHWLWHQQASWVAQACQLSRTRASIDGRSGGGGEGRCGGRRRRWC